MHEAPANGSSQKKGSRRSSTTSKVPPTASSHSHSPSSTSHTTHLAPTPSSTSEGYRNRENVQEGDVDLKRNLEEGNASRPVKKMKMESPSMPTDGL